GGIEGKALLAQPVVQHGLGTRAVGDHADAAPDILGEECLAHGADIVIGGIAIGQLDAGFLESRDIDELGDGIGAKGNAIQLAVDLAAFELIFVKPVELERAADKFIKRGNGAALGVFNDVAIVHLDDVGRIAAGRFGGELWPIIAPAEEAGVDVGAIGGLEKIVDPIGAVGAGLPA